MAYLRDRRAFGNIGTRKFRGARFGDALSPRFSGLLDQYPGAAAAYSLRALSSGWVAGDVVRARRVNTPGEANFTAGQVANGELATWALSGDAFVTTWYDQSGNANDAVQATTTAQPKIVDAGSLVTGGIDFDGVDDWLQYNGSAFSDGNISVLSVAILNAPTTPNSSIVDASDNNVLGLVGFRLDNANSNARFGTGGDGFLTSANTMTAQRLQTGINGAVNRSLFINNGEVSTDANGGDISFSGITQFKLGATSAPGSQATAVNYLDGAINEIIIYNSDQSANRAAIETNINDFYTIY